MSQRITNGHIATPRWRLAAEAGAPGGPQAGPSQNDIAQGQCFADVMGGVAQSAMNNFAGLAGALAGSAVGGSWAGAAGAMTAGVVNVSQAAFNAFNASAACQELDNAALANGLGLGGINAP